MCMTNFHPPSAGFEFGTHSTSPNRHQLYMAIVANIYAWLQELQLFAIGLHSVAIFVKYRDVSTRMTLPNFIGHCRETERQRYTCVLAQAWAKEGEEKAYVRQVLNCFDSIPPNSLGQP